MDRDGAILAAAFALRDHKETAPRIAAELRALLPNAISDVDADRRSALGDAAITVIAADPAALASFRSAVANFKSFGGALSPLPPAEVYACPQGDYRWTRPDVGYDVPTCPQHRVALELV